MSTIKIIGRNNNHNNNMRILFCLTNKMPNYLPSRTILLPYVSLVYTPTFHKLCLVY